MNKHKIIKIRFLLSHVFWVAVIFLICGILFGYYLAGSCNG